MSDKEGKDGIKEDLAARELAFLKRESEAGRLETGL